MLLRASPDGDFVRVEEVGTNVCEQVVFQNDMHAHEQVRLRLLLATLRLQTSANIQT